MDFLWQYIRRMLDDNARVLREHEQGLRPPLDDKTETVARLKSRIYGELDEDARAKIVKIARNDIANILDAMEPASGATKLYRYEIIIPKNTPVLELDRFACRNEPGEVLLPPMKCGAVNIREGGPGSCKAVIEIEYIEKLCLSTSRNKP
jgi:hypothetical protein